MSRGVLVTVPVNKLAEAHDELAVLQGERADHNATWLMGRQVTDEAEIWTVSTAYTWIVFESVMKSATEFHWERA